MMEELETEIDGILINAVDIIKFSDNGRLTTHFNVMVHPVEMIQLFAALLSL